MKKIITLTTYLLLTGNLLYGQPTKEEKLFNTILCSQPIAEEELFNTTTIFKGGILTIQQLILEGVNINTPKKTGHTPLIYSAITGKDVFTYMLLDHGASASVDIKTDRNMTALMFAARYCYSKCAWLLLHYGADTSIQNEDGETALTLALANSRSENTTLAKLLVHADYTSTAKTPSYQSYKEQAQDSFMKELLNDPHTYIQKHAKEFEFIRELEVSHHCKGRNILNIIKNRELGIRTLNHKENGKKLTDLR